MQSSRGHHETNLSPSNSPHAITKRYLGPGREHDDNPQESYILPVPLPSFDSYLRFPALALLPSPFCTSSPASSLPAPCVPSHSLPSTIPTKQPLQPMRPGVPAALHYNYQPYRSFPQNYIDSPVRVAIIHTNTKDIKSEHHHCCQPTMSSTTTSSTSSSPFTLPFHLPPNQRDDPTAAPRPLPAALAPLLNMAPVKQHSYPTAPQQTTHTLRIKNAAAAAAAEQHKQHEPAAHHQGDNKWRAARGDASAGQTIGQTTNGRQPPARQADERERRDDGGWVDWVGW